MTVSRTRRPMPASAMPASAMPVPVMLIVTYLATMPFLVGLPRGSIMPLLRPSEGLQLAVTGIGLVLVSAALINGRRWQLRITSVDWWLLGMTVAASVIPVLWLIARLQPIGPDELLGAFPFLKYAVLFLLVRVSVRSQADAMTVIKAFIGSALVIAVIAMAQALGVGPVVDILGQFFVSSVEDVVDGGRGTTTIGSSIATGAYLAIATGTALSVGLASANRLFLGAAAVLAAGTMASGQAGSVLALGVVIVVVAHLHRRTAQLLAWGLPAGLLGIIALWPIVAARLAAVDQGTGLPASWIIRWNNISELYLPSLLDGGWLLGVNPDAILQPPDVWRESVYLESGYLWLLWVGGLPLLIAAVGFLSSTWRSLKVDVNVDVDVNVNVNVNVDTGSRSAADRSVDGVLSGIRIAAMAAVAMIAVVNVLDPHLTLRAGADAFFVIVAVAMAGQPLAVPVATSSLRWRSLMAADASMVALAGARLQFAEAPKIEGSELTIKLTVREDGTELCSTRLALHRHRSKLRGVVVGHPQGNPEAQGLLWRGLAVISDSLRLEALAWEHTVSGHEPTFASRQELKSGAKVAEKLEIERMANQHRFSRLSAPPNGELAADSSSLPAIRLDLGLQLPPWKRGTDLALGGMALIMTAPIWLATAALVRRSSPGPVLYQQVRIGTGGLPFQIYKFRTMFIDNDDAAHREQNKLELRGEADAAKDSDDPRVTAVGRWLRRLSLDELPQLINIMRSEMSLVGPRPSLLWESELFEPATRRRLVARPGLTGLWQISGRADVSMSEMLELDLDYVDSMGPITDMRCLAGTVTSVLTGDGAR